MDYGTFISNLPNLKKFSWGTLPSLFLFRNISSDLNDEERELDFEIEYQLSLTTQQRFEMMFPRSREIAEMLIKNGHRKAFEIVKRSC